MSRFHQNHLKTIRKMIYQNEILELIKIANLIPYNVEVPDYKVELSTRYLSATDDNFADKSIWEESKSFSFVVGQLWNEIEEKFPQAAKYCCNFSKTNLGKKLKFADIPDISEEQREFSIKIATGRKLTNFFRLTLIRNNMRIAAYLTRKEQGNYSKNSINGIPPVHPPGEILTIMWRDEFRDIVGSELFIPFEINAKGKAEFYPNIVRELIETIGIFRIKTCANCFDIFWAKPVHSKYCGESCRNRYNVKSNYQKNKGSILQRKKENYKERK